ncbi:Hypothetical predicted protein [Mytilus galloprovincialis]|uniref:Ig-like domain-containing protein n=1 Tax=Mytilus galloprovincialis TaxID=29158 RepID=A0A8B6HM69_MYTGA|nr:Hypothetical predicted protein [Mytilus galloprovincialis]
MVGIWYKNGIPLIKSSRIEYDIDEKIHTLKIHNAELSDSAVYCIEFNGVKRKIHLQIKDYFLKALFINPEEVIEGKEVSISCEIIQKHMGGTWYKNGIPVSSTNRIECGINEKIHTLKIHNTELDDSAFYCIDFNGVKREIQLHVKDFFSKALSIEPVEALIEGQDVSISCEIIHKNMRGTWYKNGSPVSSTDRIECGINEKIHTLNIHNTVLDDRAEYCIEFNGVKREIQLHVKDLFKRPLENVSTVEGSETIFECETEKEDSPIEWYQKANRVTNNTQNVQMVKLSGYIYQLIIPKTSLSDGGKYKIQKNGVDCVAILEVKELFKRPLENVSTVEGSETIFVCETEKEDSPAEWFQKGNRVTNYTKNVQIETLPGYIHKLIIPKTSLSDGGKYNINKNGVSCAAMLEVEDGTFVTNNTNNVQMEIEKGQFYTQLITLPSLSDGGTIKLETHGIIIEAVRDVKVGKPRIDSAPPSI